MLLALSLVRQPVDPHSGGVADAQGVAGRAVLKRELSPGLYENLVQILGRREWQLADSTFPIIGQLDSFRRSQGRRKWQLADFLGRLGTSRQQPRDELKELGVTSLILGHHQTVAVSEVPQQV